MNDSVKPSQLLASINLPAQENSRLSFCNSNKANAVLGWVDNLLATKVMQTSGQLYKAVPEIPRLKTDFQNRFEMLEHLRTSVQYCILGLQKTFLNQPLILPEAAQKSVLVAQSMQKNMVDGYIATVVQITEKGKANRPTLELLGKAIHRAITGIGLLFFRNYQIYAQTPANLWSNLNILYLVADYYDLKSVPISDPTFKSKRPLTIEAIYIRTLMMASARTNQLSQTDIDVAFSSFESWCTAVKLTKGLSDDPENFLAINLMSSQGPLYKSKIADRQRGHFFELDFKTLLSQISKQSASADTIVGNAATVTVPKDFPANLLSHLLDTWGNVAQRKHERRNVDNNAEICVGLSDCHYFACNGQEFDYFLQSAGSHEPNKISRFSQGLTPASHLDEPQNSDRPVHRITLQNVSVGGYCILWQGDISAKVSAGEVIGIKEVGKRTWGVGVIRWVRQLRKASQLGVQLLSNNVKPYGAAQTYDMGGTSEYMRALFLPPSKFGQGNPTVLVAAVPFQEFDKVKMIDGEKEWSAKLEQLVFSTKSMQQFRFRTSEASHAEETQKKTRTDSFDSSWE